MQLDQNILQVCYQLVIEETFKNSNQPTSIKARINMRHLFKINQKENFPLEKKTLFSVPPLSRRELLNAGFIISLHSIFINRYFHAVPQTHQVMEKEAY